MNITAVSPNTFVSRFQAFPQNYLPVSSQDEASVRSRRQAGEGSNVRRLQALCLNHVLRARGEQFCEATVVGIRTALNTLTQEEVGELSPSWLLQVPTEVFAGLKGRFYSWLSLVQWRALSANQIGQIPVHALFGGQQEPIVFEQIPIEFIARMRPRQIPGLTEEQLRNLGRVHVLQLWNSQQLRALTNEQRQIVGQQEFEAALVESEQVPLAGFEWTPELIASRRENFFNRISQYEWSFLVFMDWVPSIEVISRLYPSTIANMPRGFIHELTPAQISGLGIEFYRSFPRLQWGTMTAGQIAAIPGDVIAQFGPNELAFIRPERIPALSNSQIRGLPEGFYNAMRPEQLQAFTPIQREAMSEEVRQAVERRISAIPVLNEVRSLTPQEISNRDAAWFNSLDIAILRQFSPQQIESISATALTGLNDVTRYRLLFDVRNMVEEQRGIQFVSPATIAALGIGFWRRLAMDDYQYFSIDQMNSINPEYFGWLRAEDVEHYVGSTFYGFIRNDRRQLRISSLPTQLIRNLSPDAWESALRWMHFLTHEQISVLRAEQMIEAERPALLQDHSILLRDYPNYLQWRRAILARMEKREFQRLPREYLRQVGYHAVPYHLLSDEQRAWAFQDAPDIVRRGNNHLELVAQLRNSIAAMSLAEVRNIPFSVWDASTPEDIRALPLHVVADESFWKIFVDENQCVDQLEVQFSACLHLLQYLRVEQWGVIPKRILQNICGYFRSLPSSVVPNIPPVAFSFFASLQVHNWPLSMIAALTAEQVAQLSPRAISPRVASALGYSQMRALSPNALRLVSPAHTAALAQQPRSLEPGFQGLIAALSVEQLNEIPPEALGAQFLERLTHEQLRGLRPDRIANIPSEAFEQLSTRVLAGILDLRVDAQGNLGFIAAADNVPQTERFEIVVFLLTREQVSSLSGNGALLRNMEEFFLQCNLGAFRAIPGQAFVHRSPEFFSHLLSDTQVSALELEQVRHIRPAAFAALGDRLNLLAPAVLGEVRPEQLDALSQESVQKLTAAQIREIPVETFRGMGYDGARRFHSFLTEEQRAAFTKEQKAFFEDLMAGVPMERAGRRDGSPPSGGAAGSARGSQGGNSGSGGGATGGGARPKDSNFIMKLRRFFPGSRRHRTQQAAFLISPQEVQERAATYLKPVPFKPTYSSIDDPEPIGYNWPEYEQALQGLSKDVLRAIPISEIPQLDTQFFEYLQAKQVMQMSEEQRNAIPRSFIRVEPIINQKFGFGSGSITYAAYRDKVSSRSLKEIQDSLSVEEVRQLAQDPKSAFLYLLEPGQLFDNPEKIAAMGEDVQSLWDARYYNALSLNQLTGVSSQVIKKMKPQLVAKLGKSFFDGSIYNRYDDKQSYQARMQALSQEQIDALGSWKTAQLGLEFFEALTLQQIRQLRSETLQAISKEVLEKLSARFYDALSSKQKKYLFLNKGAIPIIFSKISLVKAMEEVGLLQGFLGDLEDWQVQAIPVSDIKNLSGSLFSAKFLGKLNREQVECLDAKQLSLMASEFKNVDGECISYLTSLQVSQLQVVSVIALADRIGILGKKVADLNPEIFQNKEVIRVLFSELPEEGLYLLKSSQLGKIRISELPAGAFGRACREGGVQFLRQFKPSQVQQFNATQRGAIPLGIYGQLIWEIYQKKSDAQITEEAVGITPEAFRRALLDYVRGLTDSKKSAFTDQEMQQILQGTYRLKIEKATDFSPQTLVSSGGMGYCGPVDFPKPLMPNPGKGRVPGDSSRHTALRV